MWKKENYIANKAIRRLDKFSLWVFMNIEILGLGILKLKNLNLKKKIK